MTEIFTQHKTQFGALLTLAVFMAIALALPAFAQVPAAPLPQPSPSQQMQILDGGDKAYPDINEFFDYTQPFESEPVRLTATSNSSGLITYSILPGGTGEATLSGTNNQFLQTVRQGTVLLRATVAEDFRYRQAYRDIIVTIIQGNQTISFPNISDKTYGAEPFTISATGGGSGNPVVFSVKSGPATVSGNTVTITGVGRVTIRATQAGNTNFEAAAPVERSFEVKKLVPTLTFNNITKTYGDSPFNLAATASVEGDITYSVVAGGTGEVALSGARNRTVTILKAGTVKLKATIAEQPLSEAVTKEADLVIRKAEATVSLSGLTQTYTGQPRTVTATTTPEGLSTSITYAGNASAPVNAGTYEVKATITDPNYEGEATGELVVGKAAQQITFPALADKQYGDAPFELQATGTGTESEVSYSIVSGPATVAGSTLTITGAGVVRVRATKGGDTNYNAAPAVERSFTVAKKELTVQADDKQRAFGEPNPSFTLSYSGFVNGDVAADLDEAPVATTTATTASAVGTYPIEVAGGADANYAFNYNPGELTITKATAVIELSGLSQTYTGEPLAVTATTTPEGLNTTIRYEGNTTAPTNAGTYEVTATINDPNYSGEATGELVIAKASQQITFGELADKVYGDAPFELTATSTGPAESISFSVVSGPATIEENSVTITGAGAVTIRATKAGDANYAPAPSVDRSFTVSKKELTVQADDKQRVFGEQNPSFTLTYSGFVNSDEAEDLDEAPEAGTSATAASAVGTYPITVAGGNDANYTFIYEPGVLTIVKATAAVVLSDLEQTYNGEPRPVSFTTTPEGLNVRITYNGAAEAPVEAGEYTVVAVIEEENYTGDASGTLKIMAPTSVAEAGNAKAAIMLYPNPTTDGNVLIRGVEERQPVEVLILDVTGRLVWQGQLQANTAGELHLHLGSQLKAGQYFVQLSSAKIQRQVLKVVKE